MEKLQPVSPSSDHGLTFKISAWLLGLIAATQLVAVVWKALPAAVVRVSTAVQEAGNKPNETPKPTTDTQATPFRPGQGENAETPSPIEEAAMKQALTFFQEAQAAQRVGNWETALEILNRAAPILGETPEIRFRRAFFLDRLGRESESLIELEAIQTIPGISPEMSKQAATLADRTRQSIANRASFERQNITVEELSINNTPPQLPATDSLSSLPTIPSEGTAAPILETFGLQPGASLGIIDVKEVAESDKEKVLRIAIKSRPNTEIDSSEAHVHVQFFESTPEGDVVLNEVPVVSTWISPPVDWADQEPEILDVTYLMPGSEERPKGSENSSHQYHGYIVGIYHNNELQDIRAVPGDLESQFPLQLILEN